MLDESSSLSDVDDRSRCSLNTLFIMMNEAYSLLDPSFLLCRDPRNNTSLTQMIDFTCNSSDIISAKFLSENESNGKNRIIYKKMDGRIMLLCVTTANMFFAIKDQYPGS